MKVKQCNVQSRTIQKTKKVPERKCEQVPNNRRNCQTIQVPQPPIVSFFTIFMIYKSLFSSSLASSLHWLQDWVQATVLQCPQAGVQASTLQLRCSDPKCVPHMHHARSARSCLWKQPINVIMWRWQGSSTSTWDVRGVQTTKCPNVHQNEARMWDDIWKSLSICAN